MTYSNDPADVEGLHQNGVHRVILKKVNDDGDQQLVDYHGLEDESHTEVLRVMPHGLASHPPDDSEAVVVGLGTRDMPVVVGAESPKHRPRKLPKGATKLYDADEGFIYLDAQGNLHGSVKKKAFIEAGEEVHVKGKTITIEGDVIVKGNITQQGSITSTGVHKAAGHV